MLWNTLLNISKVSRITLQSFALSIGVGLFVASYGNLPFSWLWFKLTAACSFPVLLVTGFYFERKS